ncbi:MAG: 50S ribosomal protein L21 [Acidimicrobiales bacterium]|jgi:large subunit ribosomal protein L21|nr:50S ribosomal protein L21 [Acidimicrobiales bacterium]MDP6298952.1 50S ribosomal protein L21 [Acidimicrobiales bacterium]HJM27815.1 50S ribosomal protein L21 [Acidimicrobiales bacterium]HJM97262.1 50S ribosomal protein L21 [Acidimicrobiales bacterium]
MYAVVITGGKQYRVEQDQVLDVELVGETGSSVDLAPVMYVDGKTVLATPSELAEVTVKAEILGQKKGKKINGFTYKNKSNQRRRWGHRQNYNEIKITQISRNS